MKRLVLIVAVAAAALVAAAPALAAQPNPWKTVGAPSSGKAWGSKAWVVRQPAQAKGWGDVRQGSKAWDVRQPSDVRQGARAWDVRNPSQAKGWGDVRQTDVRARFAPNPWKTIRADWSS